VRRGLLFRLCWSDQLAPGKSGAASIIAIGPRAFRVSSHMWPTFCAISNALYILVTRLQGLRQTWACLPALRTSCGPPQSLAQMAFTGTGTYWGSLAMRSEVFRRLEAAAAGHIIKIRCGLCNHLITLASWRDGSPRGPNVLTAQFVRLEVFFICSVRR